MATADYTPEAEDDLWRIVGYIARDNATAASTWLTSVRETCDLIATQPAIGQLVQTARFGIIRRHVIGNYLIYYEESADGITIVHVVHGAREQDKLV